jgi:hypothetical protein
MEIIVKDGEYEATYRDVTDMYLAVRQAQPYKHEDAVGFEIQTRSYSRGGNVREIVKEIQQSLVELQEHLRRGRS